MKRREFLCNSLATTGTVVAGTTILGTETLAQGLPLELQRDFIEIKTYTVADAEKRDQLVKILDAAFIPAMNRQDNNPVGIFVPAGNDAKYDDNVFVVMRHKTFASFSGVATRLLNDKEFMEAAKDIFATDSKDPVFTTCESRLLQCFETAPVLETPELGTDRAFEMRLYRSFNIERNAAKIHMFEHGGELALFRELGLNPIFFGEAIFGRMLPNLAYMVGGKSVDELAKSWKNFGPNPKWHEIRDNLKYKDTATEIERVVLKPSPGSQI